MFWKNLFWCNFRMNSHLFWTQTHFPIEDPLLTLIINIYAHLDAQRLKSYNSVDGTKRETQDFLQRCSNSFHDVNRKKINETVIDFRDELVEQVSAYKYLGVEIDDKLVFQECALNQSKKPQQRTFFLGKPNQFRSDSRVLQTFYKSALRTVLFWLSVHFWKHGCSTSEETTVHDQGNRWNQWSPPVCLSAVHCITRD